MQSLLVVVKYFELDESSNLNERPIHIQIPFAQKIKMNVGIYSRQCFSFRVNDDVYDRKIDSLLDKK